MPILVDNKQRQQQIPTQKIHQIAQTLLNALGYPNYELSILIVDDLQISKLNSVYLNKIGPTNVIAFPMLEGIFSEINPYVMGDVVISVDTAQKEANDANITMFRRFIELLTHGVLHLVGYDHVKSNDECIIMNKMSDKLLALIKADQL